MATEQAPRVGSIVHYFWRHIGFTLGPHAAIVTRVYAMADPARPALCVDLTIFPQHMDHHTPTKEPMVWHRDAAERDRDPHRWWQWPEEEA